MALVTLQNLQLMFGTPPLFDGVNFSIQKGERVALIGRNGCGKSTLLKVIQGEIQVDDGKVIIDKSITISRMDQEIDESVSGTVYDIVAGGLGNLGSVLAQYHNVIQNPDTDQLLASMERLHTEIDAADGWSFEQKINTTLQRLNLDGGIDIRTLSGGMKRRVVLARELVKEPDLLLLDEPTNHLDIESILWLESFLINSGVSLLFITHDRAFLRKIATRIVEIDRGKMKSWPGNLDEFLMEREAADESEKKSAAEFDKKLKIEERWIRQGIKARRTRNEGRVRALKRMRSERAQRRNKAGSISIVMDNTAKSGKTVIEAKGINLSYGEHTIVKNFSTVIQRGDKIGIIGKNGIGKTTLLKLLLGKIQPDSGKIKTGTNLEIAYFDQFRETLDETKSALENVAEGSDMVTVAGKTKHIISYLQDFLFSAERVRAPITRLSGGERNRLLLAKLFTKPFNFLVLDEPTNDLDVETLEILESILVEFTGTLFLVSHDREFVDNIVSSTLVLSGDGIIEEFIGGYSDWYEHKQTMNNESNHKQFAKTTVKTPPDSTGNKLSYNQQKELEKLPKLIEELENKQQSLQEAMSEENFYKQEAKKITDIQQQLKTVEEKMTEAFSRWESLESG